MINTTLLLFINRVHNKRTYSEGDMRRGVGEIKEMFGIKTTTKIQKYWFAVESHKI